MSNSLTRVLMIVASALAVLGLALWIRYSLMEPQEMALICVQSAEMACRVRETAIAVINQQRLGYFALAAAVLAPIPRLRSLAWLGWAAGLAGLVLYCWDFSAPAAVLSLLVLARPAYASSRQSTNQA
jgi:hypothetical protein